MTPAKSLKQQSSSGSEASAAKTSWVWVCAATPQSRPAASGTTEVSGYETARANLLAVKFLAVKFRSPARSSADKATKATGCGRDRAGSPHNLGTFQGNGKNAIAGPRLELLPASDFGVIFKLDC